MLSVEWGEQAAEAAYATYIGRRGCKPILGVEVSTEGRKRLTITPLGVNSCQIDIPYEHIDAVIARLTEAKRQMDKQNHERRRPALRP